MTKTLLLLAVIAAISLVSLVSGQNSLDVIGSVNPSLTTSITSDPNLQIGSHNGGPMAPGSCYSTGSAITVTTNAPFKIETSTTPAGGHMASIAHSTTQLHQAMTCLLDSQGITFPLDIPQTMHFTGPMWVCRTNSVSITLEDRKSVV